MTVSNAFNRPDKLSAELRERIIATAATLGYAGPDPMARSLRQGRVGALGVVLGESLAYAFDDPGAMQLLRGLAGACCERGAGLQLIPTTGDDADGRLARTLQSTLSSSSGFRTTICWLRRACAVVGQCSPAVGHSSSVIPSSASMIAPLPEPRRPTS